MKQIQKEHVALVIKYTGISFITGGLSHGFFSGERQIITSLIGIGFFIIGTLLEQESGEKEYLRTIILSSVLAVSIGALTGGLQHFPDSPGRSAWIVPLGFIISVYAFLALEKKSFMKKTHLIYGGLGFVLFIVISAVFYWVVHEGNIGGGDGHGGDHHSSAIEHSISEDNHNTEDSLHLETIENIDEHVDGDGHHEGEH